MNFANGIAQRIEDVLDGGEKIGFVIEVSSVKVTTVEDVRTLRSNLNKTITLLCRNFECQTGCPVESIHERMGSIGEGSKWLIEVRL
jgi:hypothetical protein